MAGTSGSPFRPPRRWHQLVRGRYRCALRGAPGPHLRHPLRTGGATPPAWRAEAAAARERRPAAHHRQAAQFSKPTLHLGTAFGVKLSRTSYSFLLQIWRFNCTWDGRAGVRVLGMGPQLCLSARTSFKTLLIEGKTGGNAAHRSHTRVKVFQGGKVCLPPQNCGQAPRSNLWRKITGCWG